MSAGEPCLAHPDIRCLLLWALQRRPCLTCPIPRSRNAGFVNVDSEKMSKSLGNFFTIR